MCIIAQFCTFLRRNKLSYEHPTHRRPTLPTRELSFFQAFWRTLAKVRSLLQSPIVITSRPSPYVFMLVVLTHLLNLRRNHKYEPPCLSNIPNLGMHVSFQYVLAYPGQLAALCPCSLMYQFEHPAEKTEPCSWRCIRSTHLCSAELLISMMDTFRSMTGAIMLRATKSTCTSHEKRAELCAGNVFGPNLSTCQHACSLPRYGGRLTESQSWGNYVRKSPCTLERHDGLSTAGSATCRPCRRLPLE